MNIVNSDKNYSHKIDSRIEFTTFYESYYSRFLSYATYYVKDSSVAEDLVHDALLYYWENRNHVSDKTDVLSYVLLTVKNKCLNYLKHIQIEQAYTKRCLFSHNWEIEIRIQTLEEGSYSELFSKELQDLLTKSLNKLPAQTQQIFYLHRMEGITRKEIAIKLSVSQQKIDYHINKANLHLAKELKYYMPLLLLFLS